MKCLNPGIILQDVFLDINNKSKQEKEDIFRKAYELSYKWWVDILDCSKSCYRQTILMSFEDAIKRIAFDPHCVFIIRIPVTQEDPYIETGYRDMQGFNPDYFLWIHVDKNDLSEFDDYFSDIDKAYNIIKEYYKITGISRWKK